MLGKTMKTLAEKKEDLAALDASIERWNRIVRIGGDHLRWVDCGVPKCALCNLHDSRYESGTICRGCVIKEDTRRMYCRGIPYELASNGDTSAQRRVRDYLVDLKVRLEEGMKNE